MNRRSHRFPARQVYADRMHEQKVTPVIVPITLQVQYQVSLVCRILSQPQQIHEAAKSWLDRTYVYVSPCQLTAVSLSVNLQSAQQ